MTTPHPAEDLLLEFDNSALTPSHLSFELMPDMIASSSTTSCSSSSSSDCDSDSLSSSIRSPSPQFKTSSSPRSIFDSYWSTLPSSSSVSRKRMIDDEVLARLQTTLRLPSMVDDENNDQNDIPEHQGQGSSTSTTEKEQESKSSLDGIPIDYPTAMATNPATHPTRVTRRQILPPPPSITMPVSSPSSLSLPPPSSSHILLPRHDHPSCSSPSWWSGIRPWSSTPALDNNNSNNKQPSRSCLRKSKYSSFSGIPKSDDRKIHHRDRSVSFFSQVSVLEFSVPQEKKSQEGWSKYFA